VLERARAAASRLSVAAAVLVSVFLLWTYLDAVSADASGIVPGVAPVTVLGLTIAAPFLVRAGGDGLAFTATALAIALGIATIFLNLYPRVLVSSTDGAYSLTIWSTSSTHYTLVVMSIVALALLPLVLLYQGWTYYVFRHRVGRDDLAPPKSPVDVLSGGGQSHTAGD
jgi:cytochrome d ubiquinol oxidase subunit II